MIDWITIGGYFLGKKGHHIREKAKQTYDQNEVGQLFRFPIRNYRKSYDWNKVTKGRKIGK